MSLVTLCLLPLKILTKPQLCLAGFNSRREEVCEQFHRRKISRCCWRPSCKEGWVGKASIPPVLLTLQKSEQSEGEQWLAQGHTACIVQGTNHPRLPRAHTASWPLVMRCAPSGHWGDMQGPEESRVAGLAGVWCHQEASQASPWEVLKQKNDRPPAHLHWGGSWAHLTSFTDSTPWPFSPTQPGEKEVLQSSPVWSGVTFFFCFWGGPGAKVS